MRLAELGFLRYERISSRDVFSFSRVDQPRVQLALFQASVEDPSQDIPLTSPSVSDPSHLQTASGFAATIQLPYGINGSRGLVPAIFGPIHIAAPTPRVSVGVTKSRN